MIRSIITQKGLISLAQKNYNKPNIFSYNYYSYNQEILNESFAYNTQRETFQSTQIKHNLLINFNKKNFSNVNKSSKNKINNIDSDINSNKSKNSKSIENKNIKKHNEFDNKNKFKNKKTENIILQNNEDKNSFNLLKYETKLFIFNSNDIIYLNQKLKSLNEKLDNATDNPDNKQSNLIKMEKEFFKSFKSFEYSKKEVKNIPNRKYHRYIFERNFANFIILLYQENLNSPLITELAKIYSHNNTLISNNAFNYKHKVDLYSDLIINFFIENPHIDQDFKKLLFNEKISNILKYTNIELFRIFRFASEKILIDRNHYQDLFYPFNPFDKLQKNVLLKKLSDTISNKLSFIKNGYESLENFSLDYRQNIDFDIIKYAKLDTNNKEYTFPYMLGKIKYIQMYRALYDKNEIDLSYNNLNFILKKFMYKQRILNFLFQFKTYNKFFKYIEDEEFYQFFLTKLNKFMVKNFIDTPKNDDFDNYIGINKNFGLYLKYKNLFNGIPHLYDYNIGNINSTDKSNNFAKKSANDDNEKDVLEEEFMQKIKNTGLETIFKSKKSKKKSKLLKLTSKKSQIDKKENELSNKDLRDINKDNVNEKENRSSLETQSENEQEVNLEETEKPLIEKSKVKNMTQSVKYNIFEGYQFINFEINNIVEIIFNLQPLLFLENIVDSLKNRLLSNSFEGNDLNLSFKLIAFSKLKEHIFEEMQNKIPNYSKNNTQNKKQINYLKSKNFDLSIFADCYDEYLKSVEAQLSFLLANQKFYTSLKSGSETENQAYSHKNYYKKNKVANANESKSRDFYSKSELYSRRSLSEIINNLFYMRLIDLKNENVNEQFFKSIVNKIILSIKNKRSIDLFDNKVLEDLLLNDGEFQQKYKKEFAENLNLSNASASDCFEFNTNGNWFYDIALISKNQEERNKLLLILLSFNDNKNINKVNISNYFYENEKGVFFDLMKFYDNKENVFSNVNYKYQKQFISKFEKTIKDKTLKKLDFLYSFEIDYNLHNVLNLGLKMTLNNKNFLMKFVKNDNKTLDDYLFSDFYNQMILNCGFEIIEFDIKQFQDEKNCADIISNEIKSIISKIKI